MCSCFVVNATWKVRPDLEGDPYSGWALLALCTSNPVSLEGVHEDWETGHGQLRFAICAG
jgi:hypothetical protein